MNLLDVALPPGSQVMGSACIAKGGSGVIVAKGANWFVKATTSCGLGFDRSQEPENVSFQHCGPC